MTKIVLKHRELSPVSAAFQQNIHPLMQRIYAMRGITSAEQLDHSTKALLNYNLLIGIDKATHILYQAAIKQDKILIVGDFDTDGATSTALIFSALNKFGLKQVSYLIPDRFEDGYGLSISVVKKAIEQKTALVITVDNGISSFEAVEFAKQHNIQVIITDHHLAPERLPDANAIVNPNLPNCSFPSKHLAGVGVTFYFMLAFRALLREKEWFQQQSIVEYNLANLLDLVALGTVADVVDLDQNNRILVQQGLLRIRSGHCCIGIKALMAITKRNPERLTSLDLAYYLSPRINAAGRMENMSIGVELLLAKDEQSAYKLAETLERLNTDRKSIEQSMQQEALSFIDDLEKTTDEVPNSFVIYHDQFHQGVIGVLSSRIKEKFYRPVISFADAQDGLLKGSGRSIPGIHLRDILEKINMQSPKLIVCFGGHAMAAGLTIDRQNLTEFRQQFEQLITKELNHNIPKYIVETDGIINNNEFNYQTAISIKDSGPWGAGFPEPLFDGEFIIHQQKLINNRHLKLVIEPLNGGPLLNGIAFNIDTEQWLDHSIKKIQMVYNLELDEFRGNQSINLLIRHLWPLN